MDRKNARIQQRIQRKTNQRYHTHLAHHIPHQMLVVNLRTQPNQLRQIKNVHLAVRHDRIHRTLYLSKYVRVITQQTLHKCNLMHIQMNRILVLRQGTLQCINHRHRHRIHTP